MEYVSKFIEKVKERPQLYGVLAFAAVSILYMRRQKRDRRPPQGKREDKVGVNKQFYEQIKKFFPIIVPGFKSREFFDLVAIAILLVFRSLLDVWMIKNNADIVSSIVSLNYKRFVTHVVWEFGLMQFPTSLINNLLKYFISSLSLGIREKFSYHIHKKYMNGNIYYAVSNLDSRIENADQVITQDILNFCNSFGNLYSKLTKPVLDLIIFFVRLVMNFGWQGPTLMLAYFLLSGAVMTRLRTPFSKFSVEEGKLEGKLRFAHSRVITHSEEIAFYGGAKRERLFLDESFSRLTRHLSKYYIFRLLLGFFDSCITKYSATLLAYFIVTAPIFSPKNAHRYQQALGGDSNNITRDYTRYVRLLIAMVTALGTLIDSGRELSRFAGYTSRVSKFMEVLDDMQKENYQRAKVASTTESETKSEEHPGDIKEEVKEGFKLEERKGRLVEIDRTIPTIKFINVPIVTPNGDILVKEVNFTIEAGMNVLVAGPNGCGKSSLFRLLGGLWPLFDGVIERPTGANLFYVPQRPYLAIGTLRDQIIYPHTVEETTCSDEELLKILDIVSLRHVVEREPKGWDAVEDWTDKLSGGEKQRIAMARLFYHKPQFAILDECTSAVSVDVEGDMYRYAKQANITLFTVSHRRSLWKYHEYKLYFDGRGAYKFAKIEENDDEFGS